MFLVRVFGEGPASQKSTTGIPNPFPAWAGEGFTRDRARPRAEGPGSLGGGRLGPYFLKYD